LYIGYDAMYSLSYPIYSVIFAICFLFSSKIKAQFGFLHFILLVAINYAMTRQFDDKPVYHIFYDMGAGSTVASLIEFRNVRNGESKSAKNVTTIEVKASGYDRTLGGFEIDIRLRKFLADAFQEKTGKAKKVDVYKDQRAMAKLLKEANRIKHILSANNEVTASVSGCRRGFFCYFIFVLHGFERLIV
jgi:molecular chaperone DnaK (HSP70)